MQKYAGHIDQMADERTRQETNFQPGSPQFNHHKRGAIQNLFKNSFGYFAKAPEKWQYDKTYFYNRPSEIGFTKSDQQPPVGGFISKALFDIIHPRWWGGQTKIGYDASLPEKVNNKPYAPGTNCTELMIRPDWKDTVSAYRNGSQVAR